MLVWCKVRESVLHICILAESVKCDFCKEFQAVLQVSPGMNEPSYQGRRACGVFMDNVDHSEQGPFPLSKSVGLFLHVQP